MILSGAKIVTMDPGRRVLVGDVQILAGKLTAIGPSLLPLPGEEVVDLRGNVLVPGFIQGHLHLCQTLFRGVAEDLELLDWLKLRIWPLEGAHTPDSLYATARLGIAELLLGGTTTILDMGTVHHTDAIFEAARESGIRATIGKAMMDIGHEVPATLRESTDRSLQESFDLQSRWEGREGGRLRYAFAPRFVPSCSEILLREVAQAARKGGRIHTHASENRGEIALVREMTGMDNISYLHHLGLTGDYTTLAHCVWLESGEIDLLASTGSHVAHCPGSNLKLASGVAPIPRLLERGVSVCLGADGAPCNNHLDIFQEMSLAGKLQKPFHGPTIMPARRVVELATLGGAAALGMSDHLGSIEVGKQADLVALDLRRLETFPHGDIYACLVYTATRHNVRHVWVGGERVVRDGMLTHGSEEETLRLVEKEGPALFQRAGLAGLWEHHGGL